MAIASAKGPFKYLSCQGLPGDGRVRAGARKHPQNDPWGVVNSARKEIVS
jgi:hypothetical protein